MTRASMFAVAALTLACAGPSVLVSVVAQQGITRTPISTIDFPDRYQIVMGVAQIPANTCFDRHTHPGVESAYVLDGEVHLKIEGSADRDIKAGSGTQIPPVAAHAGCTAAAGAKVLTVHVVEKGKPLASPAP
jgi:quercetin dioxygenase-like cupin family protein